MMIYVLNIIMYQIYNNVPDNIKNWFRTYNRNGVLIYYIHDSIDNILMFSKNREEIALKLDAKKYNL